jgi:hypothetical protein
LNDTFRFEQATEQRAARHHSSPDDRNGRNISGNGLVARRHDVPERPEADCTVAGPVKTGSERSQLARDYRARG